MGLRDALRVEQPMQVLRHRELLQLRIDLRPDEHGARKLGVDTADDRARRAELPVGRVLEAEAEARLRLQLREQRALRRLRRTRQRRCCLLYTSPSPRDS